MLIRDYQNDDEQGWLRCRVLAFLNTAYYDNVLNKKEVYKNPSIELVAEIDGKIVGLIDVEYEKREDRLLKRDWTWRNDLAYSGSSGLCSSRDRRKFIEGC